MIEFFLNKRIWVPTSEELEKEREWIAQKISEIGGKNLLRLARKAKNVRQNAYKPYSDYSVGAAILTTDRKVFASCNMENSIYIVGHAEFGSIMAAVNSGIVNRVGRKFIDAIAVAAGGDSGPCGFCRQVMYEFADNCLVVDVNPEGQIVKIGSLKVHLPNAFGPSHLGK